MEIGLTRAVRSRSRAGRVPECGSSIAQLLVKRMRAVASEVQWWTKSGHDITFDLPRPSVLRPTEPQVLALPSAQGSVLS